MSQVTKEKILEILRESSKPLSKSALAKKLNVQGNEERVNLKRMLKELRLDGAVDRTPSRAFMVPDRLPLVTTVEISEIDIDGDVFAKPVPWNEETQGTVPSIEMKMPKTGTAAFILGERVLAKLDFVEDGVYAGEAIKRISTEKNQIMGTLFETKKGLMLRPVDKKSRYEYTVLRGEENGAEVGQVVLAEIQENQKKELKREVRIIEIIGDEEDPKIISLISLNEVGLRNKFPDEVLKETEGMKVPSVAHREDLRSVPLVTIDGADARDFDDAVFAEPDQSPKNKGGYHLIVAIADVAYYVRPGSPLDKEAYLRGNSTYFPDRVVPMLPEALSNDLCSLRPNEERAAMAMHLWIDKEGNLIKYKPARALIKSAARLIYEQVQAAKDGQTDETTEPLMENVIQPLYDAYAILDKARQKRGALDLELPERQILINDQNEMTGVTQRVRLDAHKLIEEFMVLANVAAAKALEDKKATCLYRIHDKPDNDKLLTVRDFVESFGLSFPMGQVIRPANINSVLQKAKEEQGMSHLISQVVLRSQSQAVYSKENHGHFGLALTHYAHFTSPIRRYADLFVHRSLISAYGFGEGGLSDDEKALAAEIADHISKTERKSMEAERNASDRFTATYLQDKVGAEFNGRISGVTRFAMFVTLDEIGADGIIPMRSMKDDYYIHDEEQHALIGRKTRKVFRLCAPVRVRLVDADGITGSTVLEVVGNEGAEIPGFTPKKKSFKKGHNYKKGGGKPSSYHKKKKHKKKTTPKHKRKNKKN